VAPLSVDVERSRPSRRIDPSRWISWIKVKKRKTPAKYPCPSVIFAYEKNKKRKFLPATPYTCSCNDHPTLPPPRHLQSLSDHHDIIDLRNTCCRNTTRDSCLSFRLLIAVVQPNAPTNGFSAFPV
jgi:hypothetical protein